MASILSHVQRAQQDGALNLRQLIETSFTALAVDEESDPSQLLREAVEASATALELRRVLVHLLTALLPSRGYGEVAVEKALQLLAETQGQYQEKIPTLLSPRVGEEVLSYPLVYHVVATPALPLAPECVLMLGDAHDIERGIVLLSPETLVDSPQLAARYPYLPVQAIPQHSITPDLIVEIWDGSEPLTTLHFCTIWRGMQRNVNPLAWERVSYATPQLALAYNETRVWLCPYCLHLHRSTCLMPPQPESAPVKLLGEGRCSQCQQADLCLPFFPTVHAE